VVSVTAFERLLDGLDSVDRNPEPQYDPLCGRCCGVSGPEGAWCDNCIRECREHTLRLDLTRLPKLNTGWAS
jgi:hypothetical protein